MGYHFYTVHTLTRAHVRGSNTRVDGCRSSLGVTAYKFLHIRFRYDAIRMLQCTIVIYYSTVHSSVDCDQPRFESEAAAAAQRLACGAGAADWR